MTTILIILHFLVAALAPFLPFAALRPLASTPALLGAFFVAALAATLPPLLALATSTAG